MTLNPGKLPNPLLTRLIKQLPHPDPSVVVPPGVGRDAAGIRIGHQLVAVTTDPITLTSQHLGSHSVKVNINDVACLGCRPRWYSATLLLPPGTTEADVTHLWNDISTTLQAYGIQGDAISILPETQLLADLLHFDPLGLLASGCALIVCRPEAEATLTQKTDIKRIGQLTDCKKRVIHKNKKADTLPRYDADEIISAIKNAQQHK